MTEVSLGWKLAEEESPVFRGCDHEWEEKIFADGEKDHGYGFVIEYHCKHCHKWTEGRP